MLAFIYNVQYTKILSIFCFLGYRKVWNILKQKKIKCKRSTIMNVMKELNPSAVEGRRKRRLRRRGYSVPGPDFLWHIDGYDKLKPYGFSIHGCIDGFSRRLLWLEVGSTNKQPEVIAHHFISTVKEISGLPTRIRSDDGTENSIVEAIQIALRSNHDDEYAGLGSFIIGTSPANQRIEAFWSQLAKDRPIWWREVFAQLSALGFLDASNPLALECIRFCFMDILRKELNELAVRWNRHTLSKSKTSMPSGKPNSLYFLPQLHYGVSCKFNVDMEELNEFTDPCFSRKVEDNKEEFVEFAQTILQLEGLEITRPQNINDAFQVYFLLLDHIDLCL